MSTSPALSPYPPNRAPFVQPDGHLTLPALRWCQLVETGRLASETFTTGKNADRKKLDAAGIANGSIYLETDRTSFYINVNGAWTYLAGLMSGTLDQIPNNLTPNDSRFLYYVTDYLHLLMWTGSNWVWGPGDAGSGYIVAFVAAPNPTDGWVACDGSANVSTLGPDGQLSFVTVPNTAGSFYRQ